MSVALGAGQLIAQSCVSPEPKLLHGLVVQSRGGTATLVGFDEFAPAASSPPRKFLRKDLSGGWEAELWNAAGTARIPGPVVIDSAASISTSFRQAQSLQDRWGSIGTASGTHQVLIHSGDNGISVNYAFIRDWPSYGGLAFQKDGEILGGWAYRWRPSSPGTYTVIAYVTWFGDYPGPDNASLYGAQAIGTVEWRDVPAKAQIRYSGSVVFDPQNNTTSSTGRAVGFFNRSPIDQAVTTATGNAFNSQGCSFTATSSATTRTNGPTGALCPTGTSGISQKVVAADAEDRLSEEDTERDARARLLPTLAWVSGGSAHRQKRTSGFTFSFRDLEFSVPVDIACEGRYRVIFHIEERPLGNPTATPTKSVVFAERDFPVGRHLVKGQADTAQMVLSIEGGGFLGLREDREYKVVKAEIASAYCEAPEPAGVGVSLRSVHVAISLGAGPSGHSAGELFLEGDTIDAALYSSAALQVAQSADASVTVVRDTANALRQVKAPSLLADVVASSGASAHEVRFYSLDVIGERGSDGLYIPTGAAFAVVKFENPEPGNPASGKLRITETRGARTRVSTYSRSVGAGGVATWKLERGDAAGAISTEEIVNTTVGALRTERITLKRGSTIDSVSEREITTFDWGEETTRESLDPDGANLATVSTFHTDPGANGYRQLATRTEPSGYWEKRHYDATGRIVRIVRPFLNSAFSAADETEHRVTETLYSMIAAAEGDGDTIDEQLTIVTEKTLGQITARSFVVVWSKPLTLGGESFARRSDIVATSAAAEWNAATNLVTETLTYAAGPHTGRVRRVVRPDGTATLTTHTLNADNTLTSVTASGAPNAAGDAIVDGTRVTTVANSQGQDVSEASRDIATNLELTSWDATVIDTLGRPTSIRHHDGLITTRDYACCGLLNERGRDGVLVTYDHDALGRRTHETRGGVTVRTDHDAAGRVLALVRLGGPGDDDDITLQSNSYDLAGRLYEQRDACNRLTTFAESTAATGITTRTTTHPDLGTAVETRARDGSVLAVSGSAAAPRSYAYTVAGGVYTTTETRVGEGGATTEWTQTTRDFAGRLSLTVTPLDASVASALATTSQHYNDKGQLERSVDADDVGTLYAYDDRGELTVTALDLDRDGVIDYDGIDRITRIIREVASRPLGPDTVTVLRTTTEVWGTANSNTPTNVAISEETTNGLRAWQTVPGPEGIAPPHGLTTSTVVTVDSASETRIVVTTAPDQTVVTQTYVSDRLASETVTHATLGQLRSTSQQYDAHGRLWKSTDGRNGTTTYSYFADDQLETVLTPDPDPDRTGPGDEPQLTQFGYDEAGRRSTVKQPDDAVTTTTYHPTGQVKKISGARTYPVEYFYDAQGRVKTLTTWQDHAALTGAAVTTWTYHPATGRLAEKKYAAPAAGQPQPTLAYTYTDGGRLKTRTGGRGLVTTYGYTSGGDLETITYSDATPAVAFGYDRRGRLHTVADAAGARTLDYDPSGPLADETYAVSPGALATLAIDRTFDEFARLGQVSVPSVSSVGYTYDLASRLKTVALGTSTATYTYEPNSSLLAQTAIDTGGLVRLTTTRGHDKLDRLRSIAHTPHVGAAVSAAYVYNAANQRTRALRENATAWDYGYDALGQLATARQSLVANNTTFGGRDFAFSYDDIGNRRTASRTTAGVARTSTYTPDLLNRYTQRTVPGVAEALGGAVDGSTVTLSSSATGSAIHATDRDGESFRGEVPVDNAHAAQYPELTVTAVKNNAGPLGQDAVATLTRSALVPKNPEVFSHDADGNLTADGQWSYSWDAENRLIAVETLPALVAPTGPLPADRKRKVEYVYDAQHRRVARKAYSWNATTSAWTLTSDIRFLYDGWNVIAELTHNSSTSTFNLNASYAWGLDLSGTLQGAGGVGGLLFARLHLPTSTSTHAAACDGNGNVFAYYDAATGERTARFEYGPFGEPLVDDGLAAENLTYRFGTKPRDPLTGTYYYGYRHYSPTTGKWLSRDPIEENGGVNLYGFVGNDPLSRWDLLGLYIELWYGNHPVQAGKAHSKLWLITDEQDVANNRGFTFIPAASKTERAPQGQSGACLWFISMGAGPDGDLDELIADFNRDRDVNEKLGNPSLVTTFADKAAAVSFLSTVRTRNTTMNANFRNTTLEYELFPGSSYTGFDDWDEYNSNSYISGLLGSFGYSAPASGASTPGYNKPVPAFVFTKSFSTTDELKKEWKRHYPNF